MSIGEVDLFLEFFVSNGKIEMTFEYQSQVKVTVDFSADFARLLGLRSDETYVTGKDVISEHEPNPSSNIRSVYVYCDLLEHVTVGDTKALLLRIVDKSTELEGNGIAYLIRLCTFRCKRSDGNSTELWRRCKAYPVDVSSVLQGPRG